MVHKDMRRSQRRWRSRCVFMRRLKRDWNEHGWNWGPRWYTRSWTQTTDAACSFWAQTDLCECFYDPKAQARFKDTPKTCSCWSCGNPRRAFAGKNSSALTRAEKIAFMDDREDWKKPKRREGVRMVKYQCSRCGFLLGSGPLKFGAWKTLNTSLCEGCHKIMAGRSVYWFNGKRLEYEERNIVKSPA